MPRQAERGAILAELHELMSPARVPDRPCKCCAAPAPWFGLADFAKTCLDQQNAVFPAAGRPVNYYRCSDCGFMFSNFLDDWSPDQMRREIYNEEYERADPEINGPRAERSVGIIGALFGFGRAELRLFDYGGGTGLLVDHLRAAGFAHVSGGDPFFGASNGDASEIDLVVSIEVLEHLSNPDALFVDATRMLKRDGMLLVSTLFQPPDIQELGTNWWYCAPRNGHVSLHTRESFLRLAARHAFRVASINESLHIGWRDHPSWAENLLSRYAPAS